MTLCYNCARLTTVALVCACLLFVSEATAQRVDITDVSPEPFGEITFTRLNTVENPFASPPLITRKPTTQQEAQAATGDRKFTVLSQKKGVQDQVWLPDALHAETDLRAFQTPTFTDRPTRNAQLTAQSYGFDAGIELYDESGSVPPDVHGASGGNHVVITVNGWVSVFTKAGTPVSGTSDADFFGLTEGDGITITDPKFLYDQYAQRFVGVLLYIDFNSNSNSSLAAIAYSGVNDPTTWTTLTIDTEVTVNTIDYWLDYPGWAIDEEALYLTGNWFSYPPFSYVNSFLYTIDKASLYAGTLNPATEVFFYDVTTSTGIAGSGCEFTLQPAHVYGTPPAGDTGTFLASFAGCNNGTQALMNVTRIDNPLGGVAASFEQELVDLGLVSVVGSTQPDAPQRGGSGKLATNDRRTLDAVWHDGILYTTFTTAPGASAPSDVGQSTAMLSLIDVSDASSSNWTLDDLLYLGGEDLGAGTYTYFPSVAVSDGEALVGYSYSSSSLYGGAAYSKVTISSTTTSTTLSADPVDGPRVSGIVEPAEVVKAGEGYYPWAPNRWGDYSATVVDPDGTFWIFNQFAKDVGPILQGGNSITWGTYIAQSALLALPVELTTFTADPQPDGVLLSWGTASESDNAGFEVLRSSEFGIRSDLTQYPIRTPQSALRNRAWESVAWVDGSGTTTEARTYQYTVRGLEPGVHTFRLKQVDFDGSFGYSPRVDVFVGLPNGSYVVDLYPNPFADHATMKLALRKSQNIRIEVFDALGRRMEIVHDGALEALRSYQFDLQGMNWPTGMYLIRATGEDFEATHPVMVTR